MGQIHGLPEHLELECCLRWNDLQAVNAPNLSLRVDVGEAHLVHTFAKGKKSECCFRIPNEMLPAARIDFSLLTPLADGEYLRVRRLMLSVRRCE